MSRYLLIDDDDIIQFVHRKVVERFDPEADIHVAHSVDDALSFLLNRGENEWPEVVFLDINMPIKNGFTFVEGIRDDHPDLFQKLQAQSRVFLLTSSVNPRDMRQAEACILIEELLAKPLKVGMLERLLGEELHPNPD